MGEPRRIEPRSPRALQLAGLAGRLPPPPVYRTTVSAMVRGALEEMYTREVYPSNGIAFDGDAAWALGEHAAVRVGGPERIELAGFPSALAIGGGRLAVAAGARILTFDLRPLAPLAILSGHAEHGTDLVADAELRGRIVRVTHLIRGLAVSADGARVLSACEDATLRMWDATSGRELWREHLYACVACALLPDKAVAVSSVGATAHDLATGKELWRRPLVVPTRLVAAREDLVASGNGFDLVQLTRAADGAPAGDFHVGKGWSLTSLRFLEDGVLAASKADGEVAFFEV